MIEDVPPGVYYAFVNLPGIITPLSFVSFSENAPRETMNVKAVKEFCTEVVVADSDIEITIHARRGGAISGKVSYSDGDPAINADVSIIRRTAGQPERVFAGFNASSLLSPRTDDRGRYRITGLPPGEYVVSAAETSTAPKNKRMDYSHGPPMEALFGGTDALIVTYYGGVNRIEEAVKLKVEANSELSDINITLADSAPHTLRGSVIAKLDRIPLPGATVTIDLKDRPSWASRGAQSVITDERGQWTLDGVPDGTYVLRVQPPYNIPVPGAKPEPVDPDDEGTPEKQIPTRKFVSKETETTVAGSDVVVDEFALPEGASISGTIEFPKGKEEEEEYRYVQVSWRYEGEYASGYGNTAGGYAGVFSAEGLHAGKVYLNVMSGSYMRESGDSYYAKSITLNGVDVRNKPITLAEGQTVTGVRIVMAENPAKASVKLVDGEGKPLVARRIAIVPAQESRWLFQADIDVGVTDARGVFAFTCAPGDYLVLVSGSDDSWPPNPEVIRQRSENAPRIKLAAGDNQTTTITPR